MTSTMTLPFCAAGSIAHDLAGDDAVAACRSWRGSPSATSCVDASGMRSRACSWSGTMTFASGAPAATDWPASTATCCTTPAWPARTWSASSCLRRNAASARSRSTCACCASSCAALPRRSAASRFFSNVARARRAGPRDRRTRRSRARRSRPSAPSRVSISLRRVRHRDVGVEAGDRRLLREARAVELRARAARARPRRAATSRSASSAASSASGFDSSSSTRVGARPARRAGRAPCRRAPRSAPTPSGSPSGTSVPVAAHLERERAALDGADPQLAARRPRARGSRTSARRRDRGEREHGAGDHHDAARARLAPVRGTSMRRCDCRRTCHRSLAPQRDGGLDPGRAPRRDPGREQRGRPTTAIATPREQQRLRPAARRRTGRVSDASSTSCSATAATRPIATPIATSVAGLAQHHRADLRRLRAERDAQADLVRALRDGVRHHAVDADRGEQQREAGERTSAGTSGSAGARPPPTSRRPSCAPARPAASDRARRPRAAPPGSASLGIAVGAHHDRDVAYGADRGAIR